MSTYVPTDWVDGTTPVNAANLDKMEAGIAAAHSGLAALDTRLDAEEAQPDIPPVENGKWLSGAGGALVWADPPAAGSSIEYENLWNAATPYTPGDVVKHNGVEFLAVNPSTGVDPGVATGLVVPTIGVGTSFPASPVDGDQFILVDALPTPSYSWQFIYRAAAVGNKWLFIGGAPFLTSYDASSSTSSGTPVDLGGPSFTIPRAGSYLFQYGAQVGHLEWFAGFVNLCKNGAAQVQISQSGNGTFTATQQHSFSCAAGDIIKLLYHAGGGAAPFAYRKLSVTPVKLS